MRKNALPPLDQLRELFIPNFELGTLTWAIERAQEKDRKRQRYERRFRRQADRVTERQADSA